jgi:hypothetical protein
VGLVVLGDDLLPGRHTVSFSAPPGKDLLVHMPWAAERRAPPKPVPAPRWISGDFEE